MTGFGRSEPVATPTGSHGGLFTSEAIGAACLAWLANVGAAYQTQ